MLRKWEELPDFMRTPEVRPYWEILNKRRLSLLIKRVFDFVVALIMLIVLAIPMVIIAVWIKLDSKDPVFYRQERVTTYGKHFKIHKFRTMVDNADKIGTAVTVGNDSRITKVGAKLRRVRLDEFPQLIDVLEGERGIIETTKKNADFSRVVRLIQFRYEVLCEVGKGGKQPLESQNGFLIAYFDPI